MTGKARSRIDGARHTLLWPIVAALVSLSACELERRSTRVAETPDCITGTYWVKLLDGGLADVCTAGAYDNPPSDPMTGPLDGVFDSARSVQSSIAIPRILDDDAGADPGGEATRGDAEDCAAGRMPTDASVTCAGDR